MFGNNCFRFIHKFDSANNASTCAVFFLTSITHPGLAELMLDGPEEMLDLGPQAGLGVAPRFAQRRLALALVLRLLGEQVARFAPAYLFSRGQARVVAVAAHRILPAM